MNGRTQVNNDYRHQQELTLMTKEVCLGQTKFKQTLLKHQLDMTSYKNQYHLTQKTAKNKLHMY